MHTCTGSRLSGASANESKSGRQNKNENVDRLHFLAWPPNICVRLAFGHDIFTAEPDRSNSHLDCYQPNVKTA